MICIIDRNTDIKENRLMDAVLLFSAILCCVIFISSSTAKAENSAHIAKSGEAIIDDELIPSSGFGNAPYVSADRQLRPESTSDFIAAIKNSTPFIEGRYRYEYVEQSNLPLDSSANTLRTIAGFQSGTYRNLRLALGLGNTLPITSNDKYNDGANGISKRPRIGDPRDTTLQLANLQWFGIPNTEITAGRQYLIIDNQRWVANSNWRQTRNSFDAITIKNSTLENVEFLYSFAFNANRSGGNRTPDGVYNMGTNILHATYYVRPNVKLIGYAYLMDIHDNHHLSNQTFGTRIETRQKINDIATASATAEYARYSDYADNPARFSLNYFMVEPGISFGDDEGAYGSLTTELRYEILSGDGKNSIQAPLGTRRNLTGWAEMFNTTPKNGLRDISLSNVYRYKLPLDFLEPTSFTVEWHQFYAEETNERYGHELDLGLSQKLYENYNLQIQYADYKRQTFGTDTKKLTASITFQY